jgi:hypothetical protein
LFKRKKRINNGKGKNTGEITIRELVANALIHQDLTIGGVSAMIEVYSNRIEISNPGTPVVPIERFTDGYQSRSEQMASFTRRCGICEEKSNGIDKVVQAAEVSSFRHHLSLNAILLCVIVSSLMLIDCSPVEPPPGMFHPGIDGWGDIKLLFMSRLL